MNKLGSPHSQLVVLLIPVILMLTLFGFVHSWKKAGSPSLVQSPAIHFSSGNAGDSTGVNCTACAGSSVALAYTQIESPLTDQDKIKMLREEVGKRGLRFVISCSVFSEDNPEKQFFGIVYQKSDPGSVYIEDGGKPRWTTYGTTQTDTAMNLLRAIRGEPDFFPEHKPVETHEHKKYCPPLLTGE